MLSMIDLGTIIMYGESKLKHGSIQKCEKLMFIFIIEDTVAVSIISNTDRINMIVYSTKNADCFECNNI